MLDESVPRRVVPRWRSSWVAATTPEARANKQGNASDLSSTVRLAETEFRANSSVPIASELMFVASQAGNSKLAQEAARSILAKKNDISTFSLIRSAQRVLSGNVEDSQTKTNNEFVRLGRKLLLQNYNNPILLTDVAHALTANGQSGSAERFIRSALHFAPSNRFVLRSAVRYYLHVGQKDYAHNLLLKSPLLRGDPWIQASEIAVSSVLGKTSKFVKGVDRLLQEAPVLALNFSELGSAIATVHLNSGSDKKAKKLFAKSLINPNDNTVAQAEWAARRLGLVVTEQALKVPLSFEANSTHSYRLLEIENSIQQAMQWLDDEPFSSRPIGWLGYLHSINDEFEKAAEYHQRLVQLESQASTSDLLNLNFSRIESGSVEDAAFQLIELSRAADIGAHSAHMFANAGALSYATGDQESGRKLYQRAIDAAKTRSEANTEALVRAFFARAAVKYGDPRRDAILEEATKHSTLNTNPGATHVLRRLVDTTRRAELEVSALKKVAKQKVVWDSATNTLTIR